MDTITKHINNCILKVIFAKVYIRSILMISLALGGLMFEPYSLLTVLV